ncbi:MAG: hypothetical protein GX568_02870 [Candidatus Gastranaerophilales bacterium]|nr:hypothetical protein [Candidatus Gastranaerophilales bacterium]
MIIDTSVNNPIQGLPLEQNEQVKSVENNQVGTKSPYVTLDVFNDTSEISEEALNLYQREKEVEAIKSIVLEAPLKDAELRAIMELISKGEFIDNKDLAEALSADQDLINYLYA